MLQASIEQKKKNILTIVSFVSKRTKLIQHPSSPLKHRRGYTGGSVSYAPTLNLSSNHGFEIQHHVGLHTGRESA